VIKERRFDASAVTSYSSSAAATTTAAAATPPATMQSAMVVNGMELCLGGALAASDLVVVNTLLKP
jgi:hypothetical protein